MFTKTLLKLLPVFSSAALITSCSVASQTRVPAGVSRPTPSPRVVHVLLVQPTQNSNESDLLIPAALSATDTATVLAEREGVIVSLPLEEGARVQQGDLLAEFDDAEQKVQLREAELEVSRLRVEEQQYEALIKLNRSEFDREALLASQGLVSKGDVERAEYKLDQSLHEVEKTRLATRAALAKVDVVKLEMQKSKVRAPVNGVIVRRFIGEGTTVPKNERLFEVAQLSRLELRFKVPQDTGSNFSEGQFVALSIADPKTIIGKARIKRIEPVADATTNTFGYVADVTSNVTMMPGLTVYVHLPQKDHVDSYWVPRTAFASGADLQSGHSFRVLVLSGESVAARKVVVTKIEGDQIEVESGLEKNDSLVLAPPDGLKEGERVQVE